MDKQYAPEQLIEYDAPEQLIEYDAFLVSIRNLILKYNFEYYSDSHQSSDSYSYYFKFMAIDKDGNYLDEHRIVLRISTHDHPKLNHNKKSNSFEYQVYDSWGDTQKSGKYLCQDIIVFAGDAPSNHFVSIPNALTYIDTLLRNLYNGEYYGMKKFPTPGSVLPNPYRLYYDILTIIDNNYPNKLFYTFENATKLLKSSGFDTYTPLAWAKPHIEDDFDSTKIYNYLNEYVGDILLAKSRDDMYVVFRMISNKLEILSKSEFNNIISKMDSILNS